MEIFVRNREEWTLVHNQDVLLFEGNTENVNPVSKMCKLDISSRSKYLKIEEVTRRRTCENDNTLQSRPAYLKLDRLPVLRTTSKPI